MPDEAKLLKRAQLAVGLFALGILLPFIGNYFISDDFDLLRQVQAGGPFAIWSTAPANFFRPLISVSMWANHELGGWNSWTYLLFNFALHAVNTALVYGLAIRFLDFAKANSNPRVRVSIASLAALVFLASPSHGEALFWISCRTDLLAATFGLLAVDLLLKSVTRQSFRLGIASLLALALGCLCKESVYGLVLLYLAVPVLGKGSWKLAGGACALIAMAVYLRSQVVTSAVPYGTSPMGPVGAAKAVGKIGLMLVKPLLPIEPSLAIQSNFGGLGVSGWIVLAIFAALGVALCLRLVKPSERQTEKISYWSLAIAFVATALPASFLSMSLTSPEGERFLYLPSAFGAIAASILLFQISKGRMPSIAAAAWTGLAVASCAVNGTLYRQAGEACRSSLSWFAHNPPPPKSAVLLVPDSRHGRYIWRNGFDQAIAEFAPAWSRVPRAILTYEGSLNQLRGDTVDLTTLPVLSQVRVSMSPAATTVADAYLVVIDEDGNGHASSSAKVVLPPEEPKPVR